MTISARFVALSQEHGSPAAAARALKFPINTFIRVVSGLPIRAGSQALAERCLAEYDAAALLARSAAPLALSTIPTTGELAQ